MNPPLNTNEPPQPSEPLTATDSVSGSKKPHTHINIVNAAVVIVVAAIAGAAYIEFSKLSTREAQSNTTTQQETTEKTAVDAATDTMTGSAAEENDMSVDDASTDIDDATKAATNVGDSIDENNF